MESSTRHGLFFYSYSCRCDFLISATICCFALMSLSFMIERCHISTGLWPCPGDPATIILLVSKLFYTYCKVHWCIVLLKPHTLSDIWWHTIQRFRRMVLKEVSYISAVKWCSNMNVSKSLLKLRSYHMSAQNLCWKWVWFVSFRFLKAQEWEYLCLGDHEYLKNVFYRFAQIAGTR